MAVLKMQRISICALKKDRKAILEKLQSLGVLEVDHILDEDEDFKKMDTAGQKAGFEKAASSADQALEILEKYVPESKSMFAALEGKKLIEPDKEQQIQENRQELLKAAKEIYDLDRERAEQLASITKIQNSIESLTPWLALDVPLKAVDTKRTSVFLGTMPGGTTVESVYEVLAEKASETEGADVHLISAEQSMTYLAIICMKEDAPAVEEALRSAGFARPSQTWDAVPAVQRQELEQEMEVCRDKIAEIETKIAGYSAIREDLKIVADYYRIRADKYAVLGEIPQSERTFVISGYIPECEAGYVTEYLKNSYDCAVDVEELKEEEESPVILKNNPFSASMAMSASENFM